MKYRKLHGYKYQLAESYNYHLNYKFDGQMANLSHIVLVNNLLHIKKGYAWDGASWASDKKFMRASLVHDCGYQLMRQGEIRRSFRLEWDKIMRDICLEDGMSRLRAWYVYNAVRMFGESSTHNGVEKYDKIYTVGEQNASM